jgi:putative intracellular protease/amidase
VKILMPLPRTDFDPSEAAVSWRILSGVGHDVAFATPDGSVAAADPVMATGIGLDFWSRIPGLRRLALVGLPLRADRNARAAYRELVDAAAFRAPLRYARIDAGEFGALLLPGGHAQGMREYLESAVLQRVVAAFFDAGKPVAAICHGVVLAARSLSTASGRSVLYGRRTTALTWKLERTAWYVSRFAGRCWDRDYYRTYREAPGEAAGYRSVQAEVTRALARDGDFLDVPHDAPHRWRKASGLFRDTPSDARPAFVVRDGNYVSARWPGDVHTFARTFAAVLADPEKAKDSPRRHEEHEEKQK